MRRILLVFTAALSVAYGEAFCPTDCECASRGASGENAKCTNLDPNTQFFLQPIQHLVVENVTKPLSLSERIFARLGLTYLESIKITASPMTNIHVNAFQNLTSLFDVNLSNNEVFLIHPDTFAGNQNLHRLKLTGNPLQLTQLLGTAHNYLLRSSSLTEIDLSHCQLSHVGPLTFSQLRNLVFVNLSYNYLKNVPQEVFQELEYLEELDLSNNRITKVDKNTFLKNRDLSSLRLSKNPIEQLKGINASKLDEFDISDCRLSILMRETLEGMPKLLFANFSGNRIEILSEDAFSDLTELKTLDLSRNILTGPLPQGIFKNNALLQSLNLAGNSDLKTLVDEPGFEGEHLALMNLNIASCGLTELTTGQFKGLNNLNILTVSNNSITTLSSNVFQNLTRLNYLDLSDNLIESLDPLLFETNTQLIKLKLSGNPLKELPVFAFVNLRSLELLDVHGCNLQKVWDNHKHFLKEERVLSNLRKLDISQNNIRTLHIYDFSSLEKLDKVDITRNPLDCIKSTLEVIEWFVTKSVDPYRRNERPQLEDELKFGEEKDTDEVEIVRTDLEDKLKWNGVINEICPIKTKDNEIKVDQVKQDRDSVNNLPELVVNNLPPVSNIDNVVEESAGTTFDVHEVILEDEGIAFWSAIFVLSAGLAIIYLVIYLFSEMFNRRRMVSAYIKPGTVGSHIFARGNGGAPLYYKLYEECSVPTQQTPMKKKNMVVGFTPIHTILKKGSYRVATDDNDA